jgi:hypothetical protein
LSQNALCNVIGELLIPDHNLYRSHAPRVRGASRTTKINIRANKVLNIRLTISSISIATRTYDSFWLLLELLRELHPAKPADLTDSYAGDYYPNDGFQSWMGDVHL